MRRAPRALEREAGMTLVEILVGLMILGIIMATLFNSAFLFIGHSMDSEGRLSDDVALQMIDSLFTADAQSAQTVTTNDAAGCSHGGDTALVSFASSDAGKSVLASWYLTTWHSQLMLQRRRCSNGVLVNTTDVDGVTAGTVAVTCAPSCAAPTSVTIAGQVANGIPFETTGVLRSSDS